MGETFLKIASFFIKKDKLLNFFIRYKDGENPFGIYPSCDPDALGHSNNPLILNSLSVHPESYASLSETFSGFGTSEYLTHDLEYAICAAMYYYYCNENSIEFIFDGFKEVFELSFNPAFDEVTKGEIDWSVVRDFFKKDNNRNYILFVEDFESIVNSNTNLKLLFEDTSDLLIAELALKNIGRPHFVKIEPYVHEVSEYYDEEIDDLKYKNIQQPKTRLNSIYFRNYFFLSSSNHIIRFLNRRLSLITHIDYNSDELGNFSIKFHLPVSRSSIIGSNFSEEFKSSDIVEVNLKEVLRYSQNYIEYKYLSISEEYPNMNFEALREFFTPIFPIDYHLEYDNFRNLDESSYNYYRYGSSSSRYELDYRYSYLYQYLKGKKKLSNRFIKYCMYLHNLSSAEIDNIYLNDFFLKLPYWEIPRMQQVVLENYLCKLYDEINLREQMEDAREQMEDYMDWSKDGLDDFSNADPGWYWNID